VITLAQIGPLGLQRSLEQLEHEDGSTRRRLAAAVRLKIDLEQHADLIRFEVKRHYKVASAVKSISEHVDTRHNVLKRVADRLATPAYEVPPAREWIGMPATTRKEWLTTLRDEGLLELETEKWTRYAFLLNVVHVLPQIRDGELRFETVLPHAADVIFDNSERDPSILVYDSDGGDFKRVAVDSERYWYLDKAGAVVDEYEHGLKDRRGRPVTPWIEWRISPRPDEDYWDRGRGQILVDATLAVGRVSAHMEWVRRTNAAKLSTLQADDLDDIPPEQAVTPERPLVMTSTTARFEVHDLIVSVDEFVKQISSITEDVAEHYGVRSRVIDPRVSDTGDQSLHDQEDKAKFRRSMIKFLRRAEHLLQHKTALVAQRSKHPAAVDPELVREGFRCLFPELTFVDHPKAQLETDMMAMSAGQTDHVQIYMRRHPGVDEAEASAAVRKSIDIRNEFAALLAARNLPADAEQDGDSLAQAQGRIGGLTNARPNQGPGGGSHDSGNEHHQQRAG